MEWTKVLAETPKTAIFFLMVPQLPIRDVHCHGEETEVVLTWEGMCKSWKFLPLENWWGD